MKNKSKIFASASDRPALLYGNWINNNISDFNSVLDIGAGDGILKKCFADSVKYSGLDLGSDIYRRTPEVIYIDDYSKLKAAIIKHNKVDLITIMDVLEHTPDFVDLFKLSINRSRKYIFVSLPNEFNFVNRFRFAFGKSIPCHGFELLNAKPGHKHEWLVSIEKAREILNQCAIEEGFSIGKEVYRLIQPRRPVKRLFYSPLNYLLPPQLMSGGWGDLWVKE